MGAVPRERIDSFLANNPAPFPPSVDIEVWGGITEQTPDWSNPEYIERVQRFNMTTERAQVEMIAPVVELIDDTPDEIEISELEELNILSGQDSDYLHNHVLGNLSDLQAVAELVFYQSTVTQRGIDEAANRFAVYWQGKPVLAWSVPGVDGARSQLFEDWQVALYFSISWAAFAKMSGQAQSEKVAFYRIEKRIEWLQQKNNQ